MGAFFPFRSLFFGVAGFKVVVAHTAARTNVNITVALPESRFLAATRRFYFARLTQKLKAFGILSSTRQAPVPQWIAFPFSLMP
jgi:hypothetical protein